MPRVKKFKWSEEDYTLREFIDIFSHRLPVIFNIVEGWLGRDENHTFSSDEVSIQNACVYLSIHIHAVIIMSVNLHDLGLLPYFAY